MVFRQKKIEKEVGMKRYDLIVVGAGPAGLSAAIEAAKRKMSVIVFDENAKPGGQLFKQIHKFFGSKEHKAKIRGYKIGQDLLEEAENVGVQVMLNAVVIGLYGEKEVTIQIEERLIHVKGDHIIIATGASENMITFDGWTLPGVIGAGAAQTLMNIHGIQPGEKILMLGSGNVGLVVSYQLLQAGCQVIGVVDALPRIGGYGVHAAKLARNGVPFYLSHTIVKAEGETCVTGVTIAEIDSKFNFVNGTKKQFDVDTICLAVGLSPMSQLCKMSGCLMKEDAKRGGSIPMCDAYGETSVKGIFAAGDVSGIEEASSAMIEGRMAGIASAYGLGFIEKEELEQKAQEYQKALDSLRMGMFAPKNRGIIPNKTQEGISVSMNLLKKGYLLEEEVGTYPGVKSKVGIHPVIECTQNIPCNPCQDVCGIHCIQVGSDITMLPTVDEKVTCSGCGMCVAACSGQAIFLVNEDYQEGYATVTLPYEFLPLPSVGDMGAGLDRSGKEICEAKVLEVKSIKAYDHTNLVTIIVPSSMVMKARQFRKKETMGGELCVH